MRTCVKYWVFSGIMVIWKVSLELHSRKLGSSAPQMRRIALASSIMMSCWFHTGVLAVRERRGQHAWINALTIALGFLLMNPKRSMYSRMIWWLVLDEV